MVRRVLQGGLEDGADLRRLRGRLALGAPQLPRPQQHHRLGGQRRHVAVLGVGCVDLAHRVGVGDVQRGVVLGQRRCVTSRHRLDQRLLGPGALALQRHRLLRRRVGGLILLGRHLHVVVVRAQHVGLAPVAHRAVRVGLGGEVEALGRLLVVEAVGHAQTPVEPQLRLGRLRGDLAVDRTDVVNQRHVFLNDWRRALAANDQAKQCNDKQVSH